MTATPLTSTQGAGRAGDKIFSGAALAAGCLILAVLFGVALFLVVQAIPALTAPAAEIQGGEGFFAYIWPIVIGTLIAAVIALVIATPIAIGVALFISHFAPRGLAAGLGYMVDLLAAIPSVVYGAWGAAFLAKEISPAYTWLAGNMGWLPIFQGPASATGKTILTAGIVLSVMVLPIITSLSREIFLQTPKLHEEAALALGATRWEMIKMSVLPFARPGIISAVMLGLGRALGETMAVTFVIGNAHRIGKTLMAPGTTISAAIANEFNEAVGDLYISSLIALGLILFFITFTVLALAKIMLMRMQKRAGG
jgi:phosphate transport system permease protein